MKTPRTKAITKRFLEAMYEIIRQHSVKRGKVVNVQEFALSLGYTSANFYKIEYGGRFVGMDILASACAKYRINPTYLILGEGDLFLEPTGVTVDDLSKRVLAMEKKLKLLK